MKKIVLSMLFMITSLAIAMAHEVRPAYLGIKQVSPSEYDVTWKIPALGEKVPKISPQFPSAWKVEKIEGKLINGAVIENWKVTSTEPIQGSRIMVEGLTKTLIDVLINIQLLNEERYSKIIKPNRPFYDIPTEPSSWEVIETYLILGVDHILLGIDHLLFVLALIMVTKGKWKIIKTVTAFTLAHSVTLSLAALELVNVPIPPVEAIIALSIVFLAKEILSHDESNPSLTYRHPWIVAFTFGLLHGFGFASALSETGLPQGDIPLALAFFNVGVELGQIGFIIAVLLGLKALQLIKTKWPVWLQKSPAYLIGGFSMYWVIDRVLGFWG